MDINLNNFDKMLFEGLNCTVLECLYNISGMCTSSYNIQPINSKLPDNSKITCPSAIFKKENKNA